MSKSGESRECKSLERLSRESIEKRSKIFVKRVIMSSECFLIVGQVRK